jgi:S-DNA-T family DNA segregation ATPase FtsK/SpoIIIE
MENDLLPVLAAAVMGTVFLPSQPVLGGSMLFAVGLWGAKYYMEHSKLAGVFRNVGLVNKDKQVLQLREKRRTPTGIMYRYSLPPGFCVADVEKHQDAIEGYLGKTVSISARIKDAVIEVYDEDIEQYDYEPSAELEIGKGRGGKVTVDFEQFPHLLIAGETGSGKSTLLRALITSMILKGYKLHLIDLKGGTEFAIFRNRVDSFARTEKDALMVINLYMEKVEHIYEEFFQSGVIAKKTTPEALIIDEFAELSDKDTMRTISRIAALGRAANCYIVIATQRPSAKIIEGEIKNNLTNVIGLKTANDINSRIIIDKGGLERLRGHGHGIYRRGGEFIEFQAPWLSEKRAKELIQ